MSNICLTIANISKTGGEERMCSILANQLSNMGYDVIIVSQNNYYWQPVFFQIDRRIRRFSMKRTFGEWAICRFLKRFKYDIYKYHRILKNNHIEIVIDVDTEISLSTVEAAEGLDLKIISWEHFCYQRFSQREVSHNIIDCIISKIDKLVVLTEADRENFINCAGVPQEKVCRIYNPSPIEMNHYVPHSSKKVLSMGRLEGEKGIDLLLRVWSIVEQNDDEWILEIVGDGSEKERLQSLSVSLGLKRVIFSGFTKDPYHKYEGASLFALTSKHEGFSLALVEAANMSLPSVAFDCPNGPREIIIDGKNGFIVPPYDVDLYAEHLLRIMKDDDLRNSLSMQALGTMDKFRIKSIMDQWNSLITSLLA